MCPLQPEEIRLLAEVGFLAGARGDLESARTIFETLETLRPAAAFPYAGLAMAQLNRRAQDDAVRTLERGLRMVDPADAPDLQALRALALRLAGRGSECDRAIKAAGDHPLAVALANTAPQRF